MTSVTNNATTNPSRDGPAVEMIYAELRRLLDDPDFTCSANRRRFLAFVVEETLAGRGDRLKGAVLAHEVFGRGADFDPQTDPVVRIEARRLRRDLDEYYAAHENRAQVRFAIPKGAYLATFGSLPLRASMPAEPVTLAAPNRENESHSDAVRAPDGGHKDRRHKRSLTTRAVSGLILLAAIWGLLWVRSEPPVDAAAFIPTLAVAPFKASGAEADAGLLSHGLSDQLTNDLMRFDGLRIFALPEDRTQLSEANLAALRIDYGIGYLVTGSLRATENTDQIRLLVQLRRTSGEVIWSDSFDRQQSAREIIALQDELSTSIATALGQTYGVIFDDMNDDISSGNIPSDSTFACLLRAHGYRRNFEAAQRGPVLACLETAARRDPDSSDVWAMTGWVNLDQSRFPDIDDAEREAHVAAALEATGRAVDLAPRSVLALQAHAAVLHNLGQFDRAEELLRAALALNPEDPESLHQLGWRLAVRGRLKEGTDYLRKAIDRSIDPPLRYYNLIAIQDFLDGRYDDMLITARSSAAGKSSVGNALLAIALSKSKHGSNVEIDRALDRMAELRPELARDPAAVFRRHGMTKEDSESLVSGLVDAGWSQTSSRN